MNAPSKHMPVNLSRMLLFPGCQMLMPSQSHWHPLAQMESCTGWSNIENREQTLIFLRDKDGLKRQVGVSVEDISRLWLV